MPTHNISVKTTFPWKNYFTKKQNKTNKLKTK